MLNELEAIAFEYQIIGRSRTKPWVILAKNDVIPLSSFVVKLFSKEEVENRYVIAKEVFANVIANEFELSVPRPALINVNTADFIQTLSEDFANQLGEKDYRIKFGCQYISGTLPYNDDLKLKYYDQFDDIETIFAFDNFIYNTDRNKGNPDNIRFKGESYFLIDHEYSMSITQQMIQDLQENRWIYPFANHIFYYYFLLHKKSTNNFDHFERHLGLFNPDILDPYETQLRHHHFNPPYHDYELLKRYFNVIKQKSKTFIQLLNERFSIV